MGDPASQGCPVEHELEVGTNGDHRPDKDIHGPQAVPPGAPQRRTRGCSVRKEDMLEPCTRGLGNQESMGSRGEQIGASGVRRSFRGQGSRKGVHVEPWVRGEPLGPLSPLGLSLLHCPVLAA